MEVLNFPIVALAAALVSLIGVTLYAITQRGSLRNRDEQLVVARAQAYAMLELSQAGVLFLDREHKLMGEASAAAPELLGHTCGTGTAFVQVIAELVPVTLRRETVAYLEALWKAEPTAVVDATQNPLQRVHSGSRHLALRFSRLVVDGRVHHIIVSIERISAPRLVPHTIEVPALNEETFAKRLAGETGTRPALDLSALPPIIEAGAAGQAAPPPTQPVAEVAVAPPSPQPAITSADASPVAALAPMSTGEFELGSMDITSDSVPASRQGALTHITVESTRSDAGTLATTIVPTDLIATQAAASAAPKPVEPDLSTIIDPPDPRLNEVLQELYPLNAPRLDLFLGEAREKRRAAARHPQAAGARAAGISREAGADPRTHPRCPRAGRALAAAFGERPRRAIRSGAELVARQTDSLGQRLSAIGGEARRPAFSPGHPGRGGHAAARLAREESHHGARHGNARVRHHATIRDGHGHHHSSAPAARGRLDQRHDHLRSALVCRRRRHAEGRAAFRSVEGKPGRNGGIPRRHVSEAHLAGLRRARGRAAGISPAHREDSRPAHSQRHSSRHRAARGPRRQRQAGDRHGRRAIRSRRQRRLPAQRAGRWPRSRTREDPRRSRTAGRAVRGRGEADRPAQAGHLHFPARFHHRGRRRRAWHRHGPGARPGEQGRWTRGHRHQTRRVHSASA